MSSKNRATTFDAPEERPLPIAEVFREHAPFAWRVLRRLGVSDADANDVCQEVFMVVHRRLPDFERRSSVRTWVYGICVRVAADYRKAARRRREVPREDEAEPSIEPAQERAVSVREATTLLDRILDGLDDEKRAVFVLYEIEELGMQDIAAALGCPLQTAYSRLHAARREVEAGAQRFLAKGGTR